jgi:hypothetical protein
MILTFCPYGAVFRTKEAINILNCCDGFYFLKSSNLFAKPVGAICL